MEKPLITKNDPDYKVWLANLKIKFRQTQIRAAVKVNQELLNFYWELGAEIIERQKESSWGSGFIKQLSHDLMHEFTDVKGFSIRNIERIRKWYLFYHKELTNYATGCVAIEKTKSSTIFALSPGVIISSSLLNAQTSKKLTQSLPDTLKSSLPSIKDLEEELNQVKS